MQHAQAHNDPPAAPQPLWRTQPGRRTALTGSPAHTADSDGTPPQQQQHSPPPAAPWAPSDVDEGDTASHVRPAGSPAGHVDQATSRLADPAAAEAVATPVGGAQEGWCGMRLESLELDACFRAFKQRGGAPRRAWRAADAAARWLAAEEQRMAAAAEEEGEARGAPPAGAAGSALGTSSGQRAEGKAGPAWGLAAPSAAVPEACGADGDPWGAAGAPAPLAVPSARFRPVPQAPPLRLSGLVGGGALAAMPLASLTLDGALAVRDVDMWRLAGLGGLRRVSVSGCHLITVSARWRCLAPRGLDTRIGG